MESQPKYAIIRLRLGDDVFNLFRLLVENGYPEVSFVNALRENILFPGDGGGGESTSSPHRFSHSASSTQPNSAVGNNDSTSSPNHINDTGSEPSADGNHKRQLAPPTKGYEEPLVAARLNKDGTANTGVLLPQQTAAASAVPFCRQTMTSLFGASALFTPPEHVIAADGAFDFGGGLTATGVTYSNEATQHELQHLLNTQSTPLISTTAAGVLRNGGDQRRIETTPVTTVTPNTRRLMVTHNGGDAARGAASTDRNSPNNGCTTTNAQLRQRGSRAHNEDPNVYATCQLCHNKIMASRLSNLTNHVRRHAVLKQFQCSYCEYTHNEMAKVRLHMLHNHKDRDSQPIDNLSPEMQAQWDILMDQCFPEYNRETFSKGDNNVARNVSQVVVGSAGRPSFTNGGPAVTNGGGAVATSNPIRPESAAGNRNRRPQEAAPAADDGSKAKKAHQSDNAPKSDETTERAIKVSPESSALFTCVECGEMAQEGESMEYHLQTAHPQDCLTFLCSSCSYENTDQWKVRLHISLKHSNVTEDKIELRQGAAKLSELVPRFFPGVAKQSNQEMSKASAIKTETDGCSEGAASPNNSNCEAATEEPMAAAMDGENSVTDSTSLDKDCISPLNSVQSTQSSKEEKGTVPSLLTQMQSEEIAESIRCELCKKMMPGERRLSTLMRHAKRHYHTKQFQCRHCAYGSSRAAHVLKHSRLKHATAAADAKSPINNKSSFLQSAWMQVMARCFPSIAPRLSKYRGKPSAGLDDSRPRQKCAPGDTLTLSSDLKATAAIANDTKNGIVPFGFQSCDLPLHRSQCRLCAKLVTDGERDAHAASHVPAATTTTTKKPYACSICTFSAADYRHLRTHLLLKHKLKSGTTGVSEKTGKSRTSSDGAGLKEQYFTICFGE